MRTIPKLAGDPAQLNAHQARNAIEERRQRAAELLARDDDQLSAAEVDELRELNNEIQSLELHHEPDPAHRMRHSTGRRSGIDRDTAVLEANQSFTDWARVHGVIGRQPSSDTPNFGKWLKGVTTGDWSGAQLEASLGEGSTGAGGALVPAPLSAELIDLARARARVMQAGARTVPMQSATLAIARLASDPGSNWKAENAAVTEGADPTFERVTLTAQTLIAFVRASRELLEDAANMSEVLRGAFVKALSLKLDKAALYGSGVSPEPKGIKNQSGITTISMGTNGAQLTNYDPLVNQAEQLWTANFDTPQASIMAPRTRATIGRLKDTTNQPLRAPDELAGVQRYDTTQVPVNLTQGTSNLASDLFSARWENLLIGIRHDITIEVLNQRYAADNFQVGFIAHLRADIQLAHPAAFVVTTGIIP